MSPTTTRASISKKIDIVAQTVELLASEVSNDEASRKRLIEVLQQAVMRVESPEEVIWKLMMPLNVSAPLEVMIQLGIVRDLCTAKIPKTARELSASSGGDELLIIRLMRPLCAAGVFREVAVHAYESTPISEELMSGPLVGGYQFMFEYCTYPLANMPRYLKRMGYKNVGSAPGPFQDAYHTAEGMFEWIMNNNRPMMSDFSAFMVAALRARKNWFEAFPVDDIILNGAKKESNSVLIVDIAGGEGVDIEAFHHAFPAAPGALILQDLGPVIDNIKSLDVTVIRQKHNMFDKQTVQGARAYYLGHVLHHWADGECVAILKNIAEVMEVGYSKLLIFDWVLPERDVPLYPSFRDINMMASVNGMERTRVQWEVLMKQAGLNIVKLWDNGPHAEGLIEAVLEVQQRSLQAGFQAR